MGKASLSSLCWVFPWFSTLFFCIWRCFGSVGGLLLVGLVWSWGSSSLFSLPVFSCAKGVVLVARQDCVVLRCASCLLSRDCALQAIKVNQHRKERSGVVGSVGLHYLGGVCSWLLVLFSSPIVFTACPVSLSLHVWRITAWFWLGMGTGKSDIELKSINRALGLFFLGSGFVAPGFFFCYLCFFGRGDGFYRFVIRETDGNQIKGKLAQGQTGSSTNHQQIIIIAINR